MHVRNVLGDGNCYLRVLSVCLRGYENNHSALRQSIMRHILLLADEGKSLPGICMNVSDKRVHQQMDCLMREKM